MTVKILAVGAGAPGLRLATADVNAGWNRKGGRGHSAVCAPDEDTLTLGWTAADAALRSAGIGPDAVDGLWWGTTRPPFAEGPSHAVLASALGLGAHTVGALVAGSTHCGFDALTAAADALAAGRVSTALVVVSDALRPGLGTSFEGRCGAGAAALLLARSDSASDGAATLGTVRTYVQPLLDRYRGDTELDTRDLYDGRLFREEIFLPIVGEVAAAVAGDAECTAWSLPDPDGRLGGAIAKKVRAGADAVVSAPVYAALGDTGAAAALLGAIGALTTPGTIGVVAYGGGRASGTTITVTAPVPGADGVAAALEADARPVNYPTVLRARTQLTPNGETIAMGVPPESAMFVRGAHEMLQMLGGKCEDCGTINTPPSIHPHCIACGGPKMEPVELAREGSVHTYVVNHTMPAPFEAPLPIAVLDLDDGARIMLQVADDGSNVSIGRRMRLVLRRYAYERGAPVYGFKAKPAKEI